MGRFVVGNSLWECKRFGLDIKNLRFEMWKPKTEKGKRKSLARLFRITLGKMEAGVGEDNLVGTIEGADSTLESLFRHGEAR